MTKDELNDIIETLTELQTKAQDDEDYIIAVEYQMELLRFTNNFE